MHLGDFLLDLCQAFGKGAIKSKAFKLATYSSNHGHIIIFFHIRTSHFSLISWTQTNPKKQIQTGNPLETSVLRNTQLRKTCFKCWFYRNSVCLVHRSMNKSNTATSPSHQPKNSHHRITKNSTSRFLLNTSHQTNSQGHSNLGSLGVCFLEPPAAGEVWDMVVLGGKSHLEALKYAQKAMSNKQHLESSKPFQPLHISWGHAQKEPTWVRLLLKCFQQKRAEGIFLFNVRSFCKQLHSTPQLSLNCRYL